MPGVSPTPPVPGLPCIAHKKAGVGGGGNLVDPDHTTAGAGPRGTSLVSRVSAAVLAILSSQECCLRILYAWPRLGTPFAASFPTGQGGGGRGPSPSRHPFPRYLQTRASRGSPVKSALRGTNSLSLVLRTIHLHILSQHIASYFTHIAALPPTTIHSITSFSINHYFLSLSHPLKLP